MKTFKELVYDYLFGRGYQHAVNAAQIADDVGIDKETVRQICSELWLEGIICRDCAPEYAEDPDAVKYWNVL